MADNCAVLLGNDYGDFDTDELIRMDQEMIAQEQSQYNSGGSFVLNEGGDFDTERLAQGQSLYSCGGSFVSEDGDSLDASTVDNGNHVAMRKAAHQLALMGPVSTCEDAMAVIRCTATVAASNLQAGSDNQARDLLQAHVQEWLLRSLGLNEEDRRLLIAEFQSLCRHGASSEAAIEPALHELWSMRVQNCAIHFKQGTDVVRNGNTWSADSFLGNVNDRKTDMTSLVLCMRILSPECHCTVYEYLRMCSQEQACGLHEWDVFLRVWDTPYSRCVKESLYSTFVQIWRASVASHPFIREVIPKLFCGFNVYEYTKGEKDLQFTLDDGCVATRTYKLSYDTGEIRVEGEGVIYGLYGLKEFFVKNGGPKLMAELLVAVGIGKTVAFDKIHRGWRIYDLTTGTWRHPSTEHEPQSIVGDTVMQQLEPLIQLQSFRGTQCPWSGAADDEGSGDDCNSSDETGEDDECDSDEQDQNGGPLNSSSHTSARGGRKRAMQQPTGHGGSHKKKKVPNFIGSRIVLAKYRFGQALKDQTEVLKFLAILLIIDFGKQQQKHLLCCPNGVVDLRTAQLIGPPTPEHFFTQRCPINYNPNVDTQLAIDFFEQAFPTDAYPDATDIVRFLQQYFGYCLTLETNLQFCLFIFGRGANAKSLWMKVLSDVWGQLCYTLPIEALGKARGSNNDSLCNATTTARLATLSKSNGAAKFDSGTFNTVVCGEEITLKRMYREEENIIPMMKLVFVLNDLPQFSGEAYHTSRRCAFLPLRKIFYDHNSDRDQQLMAEHRERGHPESLIGRRDVNYYENHVKGMEEVFLRFFVIGAGAYYSAGMIIAIPRTMQFQAKCEAFDLSCAVQEFVMERLEFDAGGKVLVVTMYNEFLLMYKDHVNAASCSDSNFGKLLAEHIGSSGGWRDQVAKTSFRVGGGAPKRGYINVRITRLRS